MFSLFSKKKFESINVRDLSEKLGKINLIDVRESGEFKAGHVPKAKNIPMNILLKNPEKYLNEKEEYHIICQSGSRSSKTCANLSSQGYQVVNVSGGTGGYPLPLKK
ncbi:rhodanese-like domain-containing protein [Acetobacterium paludosum]|uniref:Rhodanese-like domain-containing protein n=1 Tax=Acetobacterium paludosum TaxID=52693 RepID=A0A923HYN1_9FIRM|nr:rhodanese-like domain-containing protein [Acetobacterium paludosum]MBC3886993.1 rhodanese-like domain-containing protein [Acetobacterium paludosum]